MANIPNHVEPGDIVKSVEFNGIVDVLQDLTVRVLALESGGASGGGVAIFSVAPEGDLRVGQEVTIFGRNFGYSIGAQRVFFNSVRVTIFKTGSSDEKLIIEIPDVPGVSESGTPVTLSATNFTSSAFEASNTQTHTTGSTGKCLAQFSQRNAGDGRCRLET